MSLHGEVYERRLVWRHRMGKGFEWLCRLATLAALSTLVMLLGSIIATALSPGRGRGLAPVTLSSGSPAETAQNADAKSPDENVTYRVRSVLGGQFVKADHPDQTIKVFTADDIRHDRIRFDHDGKRKAPVFDLERTASNGSSIVLSKIGVEPQPAGELIPDIQAPPPSKTSGWLTWNFLTHYNSYDPLEAGILGGLWGSFWLIGLTTMMAVPLGVGAAVYLEEYAKPTRLTKLIQLNIANLAGVPSIVYGILGFTVFSRMFGMFDKEKTVLSVHLLIFAPIDIPLPLGPVVLSGACTLALLSLPIIIIASQEALRSVPASLRHAAYALGATKWQTIWHQVLPASLPGILTGVILSLSRAIGEAAPLMVIGVAAQLSYSPGRITGVSDVVQHPDKLLRAPFDRFTALPIQIYSWITEADQNFEHVAAAGILVLLGCLLSVNGIAIFIRQRFQQRIRW